jgi:hypothetical protein
MQASYAVILSWQQLCLWLWRKEFPCPQLQRAADDGSSVEQFSVQEAILPSVVACLCHEDMCVASSAVGLLISLGTSPAGLNILFSAPMVQALKGAMAQQDIIRFRVYEVMAGMSSLVSVLCMFHLDCWTWKVKALQAWNEQDLWEPQISNWQVPCTHSSHHFGRWQSCIASKPNVRPCEMQMCSCPWRSESVILLLYVYAFFWWFTSVWSLNANVSEHCVCSNFIGE